jgi:leader peptidase (prepilin peptidase)/N-methyltransferase
VSSPVAVAVCAAAGIPVGAFLNVVIERSPDRVPLRATVDGERHPPRSWLGVPVQPWLLRRPGDPGSRRLRWLVVELVTAAAFGILAARFESTEVVVPLLVVAAGLVAVSAVDLEHLRIPDRITFPTLGLAALAMAVVSFDRDVPGALAGAALGAAFYFVVLLLPHLVYPRGMGFGDVKLALLMGGALGWLGADAPDTDPLRLVLQAMVLGCVLGVVFGLGHQLLTRRRGEFPFGPALALACFLVLLSIPQPSGV